MPKNANGKKTKNSKIQHLVNADQQPISETTALELKLAKAEIERLVDAMLAPITAAITLGSGFPFVISRIVFSLLKEDWTLIPLNYIYQAYYQRTLEDWRKYFLASHTQTDDSYLFSVVAAFAGFVEEDRIALTDSENNLIRSVETGLNALYENRIELADIRPKLIQVVELFWDSVVARRVNLTNTAPTLLQLTNGINNLVQNSHRQALKTVNNCGAILQRTTSVAITLILKKYLLDPQINKYIPLRQLQGVRAIQLAHIHTQAAGEKSLEVLVQLKGTMQTRLQLMRIVARILFVILLVNSLLRNDDNLDVISRFLDFLMSSFTITLSMFVFSNLRSDAADLYHYFRDPVLLDASRKSLQELTQSISSAPWHKEYKGSLKNSYVYLDLTEFKNASLNFSSLALFKIRNTLIGIFLKYKIPVIFGTHDRIYFNPDFVLSSHTKQQLGEEIQQELQFLLSTTINKPLVIKQLNEITNVCGINIKLQAQPFRNQQGVRDYQFVVRGLSKDEASMDGFYNYLNRLYGDERIKGYETINQEINFIIDGSLPADQRDLNQIKAELRKARDNLFSAAQATVTLLQSERISITEDIMGGVTPRKNPQYVKPKQEKLTSQEAKQSLAADKSAKALIIRWQSGVCFDSTKPNNGEDDIVETSAKHLPNGTRFALFTAAPENFPTKAEYDAFKAACEANSIVPTDTWVQLNNGSWFHADRKVKIATKDARLYLSDREVTVVDGKERTLDKFGVYVSRTHK